MSNVTISIGGSTLSAEQLAQLASREQQSNSQTSVAPAAAPAAPVDATTCLVQVVRQGKGDQNFEVGAKTTVKKLLDDNGYTLTGHTIKKSSNGSPAAEVSNPATCELGEGEHILFVTPKVQGGVEE